MVPAIAMMLLVMGAAMALVLDRLWLDSAQIELRSAAEAAVLAAGHVFLEDDTLVLRPSKQDSVYKADLLERARLAATEIAALNPVAGRSVQLDTSPEGDIRFGHVVNSDQAPEPVFLESDHNPNTIVVLASRLRKFGNPVATLFQELTGRPQADALELAEAMLDSRVVGLQPLEDLTIPALPLGILSVDPFLRTEQTWQTMIETGLGGDGYRFDQSSQSILKEADGIPELVLDTKLLGSDEESELFNVVLLDFPSPTATQDALQRQIRTGLDPQDLSTFDGRLYFEYGPVALTGAATLKESLLSSLSSAIGQKRIVFLYNESFELPKQTFQGQPRHQIFALKPIAIRLMAIRVSQSGDLQLVVQPCVMTSRTVLVHESPIWSGDGQTFSNRYLCKLYLSQ